MKQNRFPGGRRIAVLLCLLCAVLTACAPAKQAGEARVLVDGQSWTGPEAARRTDGELRVYITLDGAPLIDLPFDQAHTVSVVQPDGAENIVEFTGDAVRMASANCENQDCVHMGDVTRDNLELRVMGGFIICLPHRLSVEVRGE